MRTHGLPLPDHFFTFLAWEAGLVLAESQVLGEILEMRGVGIGSMPLDPVQVEKLRARFDDRLVYRYYRDPPEFLTVIHGGTDGLHYGLWYDDPRDGCTAVASYYNNDSCEINWAGGSEGYSTDPAEVLEWRVKLAVLRDSLLEYEPDLTPDARARFEIGTEAYRERARTFWTDRIATRDAIGVKVPGVTLSRDPKEVSDTIEAGSDDMHALITEALAECGAGRPALALALGRDFFSLSCAGHEEREAIAAQLLEAAYRALGRAPLAEIATIHHRYRSLPRVDDFRCPGEEPQG